MPTIERHIDEDDKRCWLCKFYGWKYREPFGNRQLGAAYCFECDDWFPNQFNPPEGADLKQRKAWRPPGMRTCDAWQ